MRLPVADREDHPAAGELVDRVHHTVDLRGGSDDANTNGLAFGLAAHEPVLGDSEVVGAVNFFEGLHFLLGWEQELRGMGTALGELNEGPFRVPAKEGGRVRRAVRAQEVE